MQINEITKDEKVELEVKCTGRIMSFQSKVLEVKDNTILISPIKINDQTLGFSDLPCLINFLYKADNKVYLWENISVKLAKYDEKTYHIVELEGEGKPYNRREAFRLYIGEDMPLYINTSRGLSSITVLVKDISELGVAFITKEELDLDRTFRLKLRDTNSMIILNGVIIRKEFLSNLNSYLYGCKFYKRNDKVSKFIAKKQIEQLQMKNNYSSPPITVNKNKKKKVIDS